LEGLILFLAELLRILLTAAVVLLLMLFLVPELVVAVLEVIFRLFFVVRGRSEQAKKWLRWIRIGGLVFLVIFVVCMIAAAILNTFFFESSLSGFHYQRKNWDFLSDSVPQRNSLEARDPAGLFSHLAPPFF